MTTAASALNPDRCFSPDPAQRSLARDLYVLVKGLPLVCPHGHGDPRLLADPNVNFGSPAQLLVIPDHYIFRMLYAQGVPLEALGVPLDGPDGPSAGMRLEDDHRAIWQRFAERFYLFRGTPTGAWLAAELHEVFGITEKLDGRNAQAIYDALVDRLARPEFRPRALFERFNIEVLCTTDSAGDPLTYHQQIRASTWGAHPATGEPRVRPTFRPDQALNLRAPGWRAEIEALGDATGAEITSYEALIWALEARRGYFKQLGAKATDHAAVTPYTDALDPAEAGAIFTRALRGQATPEDARRFTGHMLMEMARMSIEDGLVMQLHVGALRGTNPAIARHFGADKGDDIPVATEWTYNLQPLLHRYGNDSRLTLVLFCLDESTYSREMAPLASHWPAVRLGPPWWFHDSYNGMRRYFDLVVETAGLYNTAGFNDDTRAFPSIPARHDLWRRTACDWIAGLLVRGLIDEEDAQEMAVDCAYRLAKRVYRL